MRSELLDTVVKLLYLPPMEDKQELIKDVLQCVRRIVEKHVQINESPLRFSDDIVLSPRDIRAVDFIGNAGAVNVSEVAAHFHFTKSAASQLVARLVGMEFVDKQVSAHSNKEVRLSLTARGRKAHQVYTDLMREHMGELMRRLDAFSVQQISTASVMLEVMEDVFGEQCGKMV